MSASATKKRSGSLSTLILLCIAAATLFGIVQRLRTLRQGAAPPAREPESGVAAAAPGSSPPNPALPPPPPVEELNLDDGAPRLAEDTGRKPLPASAPERTERTARKIPPSGLERGSTCTLRLRSGKKIKGILETVAQDRVVVRDKYGVMAYSVREIEPADLATYFPGRFDPPPDTPPAKPTATPTADRTAGTTEPTAVAPSPPATARPGPAATRPDGSFRYDTTPRKTPENLLPLLKAFGQWLEMQHRRVGGKIADKIHAKQQGDRVVLYLRMNPLFSQQDRNVRFGTAEGIVKFWAERCLGAKKIRDLSQAHVVLVDPEGRIVGGSKPENGAAVWVR